MTAGPAFLHCARCEEILRRLPSDDLEGEEEVRAFLERHAACGVAALQPTGRSRADGPWHEPLTARRVEVAGPDGLAVAVGTRASLEEPIRWRLEPGELGEETEIELDEEEFWSAVDRALFPHHLPLGRLEAWAAHLGRVARAASPEDLLLLFDDPGDPSVSHGCFTPTAVARIQGSLGSFGFDPFTEQQLARAFAAHAFPPLRIRRRGAP